MMEKVKIAISLIGPGSHILGYPDRKNQMQFVFPNNGVARRKGGANP
jgi:hypothetical protein